MVQILLLIHKQLMVVVQDIRLLQIMEQQIPLVVVAVGTIIIKVVLKAILAVLVQARETMVVMVKHLQDQHLAVVVVVD
jgi:hypothetical protein